MGEPLDTVRALRRVAAAELSLDAPLDRGDRDSASFGERFAGADGRDIEEDVEATARRHYLETMFDSYLTERERKILLPLLRSGRRGGTHARGDRLASGRDPRTHPADS